MNKTIRMTGAVLLSVLFLGMVGSAVYNVWDNQRVKVVEQEIVIDRLPQSFDGFRILQISDLHGQVFGEKQSRLVAAINRLDYDLIAFTGDMNARTASSSIEDSQAILDVLDGIERKDNLFWIDGNNGPFADDDYLGITTGDPTPIGAVLEAKGSQFLALPAAFERGADRIWITPEMSEGYFERFRYLIDRAEYLEEEEDAARLKAFYPKAYAAFEAIRDNGEVKILLTHVPRQTFTSGEQAAGELDYNLILAGHYHAGQIRLPLVGAVIIPSMVGDFPNHGLFPPDEQIVGLGSYGEIPQYISAGLGASSPVRWLKFRLFNTPEINLITLRAPEEG